MKTTIIVALLVSSALSYIYAAPVIINDTGDWAGEIQAKEEGFLFYDAGVWTQYGANFHSGKRITSLFDNFSPIITNEGTNYVTCTYDQVGWIWPYGGPRLEETISFNTYKLIISTTTNLQTSSYTIASINMIGPKSAADFPPNGSFGFSETLKTFDPIIAGIGERASWMGSGISVLSLFLGAYGLGPGRAAVILDGVSRVIDTAATIKEVDFSGTYAPSITPTGAQTWSIHGYAEASLYRLNVLMYDDDNNDGYVSTGATTTKYFPYLKNPTLRYELKLYN